MATSGVRITYKFNLAQGLKTCGWSESYDTIFPNIGSARNSLAQIDQFTTLRLNCLGTGVVLVSCTLTASNQGIIIPPQPRRATVELPVPLLPEGPISGFSYNKNMQNSPADYATTVLYFTASTDPDVTPTYRRNIWIAGIPDAADSTDQVQPVGGAWNTAFKAFGNALSPQRTGKLVTQSIISIRSLDTSLGNPLRHVAVYNPLLNQYTVPAHGFLQGQLIKAEGFKPKPGQTAPSGQYKCFVVDVNTISLTGAAASNATIPPGGFRAVQYIWNQVYDAVQLGFSKRNKGRPFELLRGRRSAPKTVRA